MKKLPILLISLLFASVFAANTPVNNAILTGNATVPGASSLTIQSGASIIAAPGSTVTGFGGGGGGGNVTTTGSNLLNFPTTGNTNITITANGTMAELGLPQTFSGVNTFTGNMVVQGITINAASIIGNFTGSVDNFTGSSITFTGATIIGLPATAINATGTANSTTALFGDNTWKVIGAGGTAPFNIANFTLNGLLVGNNTGVATILAAGTTGQDLEISGGAPTWVGTLSSQLQGNITQFGAVTAGSLGAAVTGTNGTISGNDTAQLATFDSVLKWTGSSNITTLNGAGETGGNWTFTGATYGVNGTVSGNDTNQFVTNDGLLNYTPHIAAYGSPLAYVLGSGLPYINPGLGTNSTVTIGGSFGVNSTSETFIQNTATGALVPGNVNVLAVEATDHGRDSAVRFLSGNAGGNIHLEFGAVGVGGNLGASIYRSTYLATSTGYDPVSGNATQNLPLGINLVWEGDLGAITTGSGYSTFNPSALARMAIDPNMVWSLNMPNGSGGTAEFGKYEFMVTAPGLSTPTQATLYGYNTNSNGFAQYNVNQNNGNSGNNTLGFGAYGPGFSLGEIAANGTFILANSPATYICNDFANSRVEILTNGFNTGNLVATFNGTATYALALVGGANITGASTFGSGVTITGGETFGSGYSGNFTMSGGAATVVNTNVTAKSVILFSTATLSNVSGIPPTVQTLNAGANFTVVGQAGDSSTYNYVIIFTH